MIKKGTLVCRSKPFIFAIADKCKGDYCDFCAKRNNYLRKCNQCSYNYYCDKTCQRKAWRAGHKHECLKIKDFKAANAKKSPADNIILFFRAIYKSKHRGNRKEADGGTWYGFDGTWHGIGRNRSFQDLESHVDDILANDYRAEDFNKMVEGLNDLLPPDDLPPLNDLLEIYSKIRINGDVMRNDDFDIIGRAVYLGASIFDHSCQPNAVAVNDGADKFVYLIEDIPRPQWEKNENIFVSYIDLQMTTKERRHALKKAYDFDCNCVKCLDLHADQLLESLKCPNPKCEAPVLVGDWPISCSKCRTTLSKQRVKSALAAMDSCKKLYCRLIPYSNFNGLKFTIEQCEQIITMSKPFLHPDNIHLFRIAKLTCDMLVWNYDDLCRAFPLIDNIVLPFLKKTGNNYCPETGVFLLKIAKSAHLIGEDFFIHQYLKEAFEILAVTRGVSRKGLMPYREMMAVVDSSFDPNFSD